MVQDKRKNPTKNQEQLYFAEVGGLCPLCGKALIQVGKTKYVKQYKIAHIYPCNPTSKDISALVGIIPPQDTEAFDNKIALCLACHHTYDDDKTLGRYNELKSKKDRLLAETSIKNIIGDYQLEDDISDILSNLSNIDDKTFSSLSLNIDALKIKEKIEDDYRLLRRTIESNVTKYYPLVQKMLKELEKVKKKIVSLEMYIEALDCLYLLEKFHLTRKKRQY